MRSDRRPAVSDGVTGFAAFYNRGIVPPAISPQEFVALRVEAGESLRTGEECKVITSFPVLGLVIDNSILDLNLADAEIALEVRGVVLRVPPAKFDRGKDREFRCLLAMVRNGELPDLEILVERHKVAGAGRNAAELRGNRGVAHAVAAGVVLELAASRLPGRGPELPRGVVAEIDIPPAEIEGSIVVAVTGDPAQASIAIKGIPSRGIGDDAEIGLA